MTRATLYRDQNGIYEAVQCVMDTPIAWEEKLDEALDEGQITIYACPVKVFPPLTQLRIVMEEHDETGNMYSVVREMYWAVASDNAQEAPNGSGLYTHVIALIERTKELEGITCQSLTFTNERLTTGFAATNTPAVPVFDGTTVRTSEGDISKTDSDLRLDGAPRCITSGKAFDFPGFSAAYDACRKSLVRLITSGGVPESNITDFALLRSLGTVDPVGTAYTSIAIDAASPVLYTVANASYTPTVDGTQREYTLRYSILMSCKVLNVTTYASYRFSLTVTAIPAEDTLPRKKNTMLYCFDRVLDLAEPIRAGESPRYVIDPEQADWLDGIMAPDFALTNCTLREQLRALAGYVHCEPRLMDPVTAADGSYTGGNVIHLDPYATGTPETVRGDYEMRTVAQSVNEWCTDLDATASNAVAVNGYGGAVRAMAKTLRTETAYVRVNEENGIVKTAYPVYDIVKVECGITNGQYEGTPTSTVMYVPLTDITAYVVEQAEYAALYSSYSTTYPYSKAYAIYYTQGSRDLDGLFFKAENALGTAVFSYYAIVNILAEATGFGRETIRNALLIRGYACLAFRVTYVPMSSYRIRAGKQTFDWTDRRYTRFYNQSENVIETSYFGEQLKGAVERMGRPETHTVNKYKNLSAVPRVGGPASTGEGIITSVKMLFDASYTSAELTFTPYFNRLSPYIGVDSAKRVFEVSEKEAYRRHITIKEHVVFGKVTDSAGDKPAARSIRPIRRVFDKTISTTQPICAVNAYGGTKSTPAYTTRTWTTGQGEAQVHASVRVLDSIVYIVFECDIGDAYGAIISYEATDAAGATHTGTINVPAFPYTYYPGYNAMDAHMTAYTLYLPALQPVLLPVTSVAIGRSMAFTWEYADNYSAGPTTTYGEYKGASGGTVSGWWQDGVPYANDYGRIRYLNWSLLTSGDMPPDSNATLPPLLPACGVVKPSTGVLIGTRENAPELVRKDSREALSVTYSLECNTDCPSLIIGSGVSALCNLVTDPNAEALKLPDGNSLESLPVELVTMSTALDRFARTYTGAAKATYKLTFEDGANEFYIVIPTALKESTDPWCIRAPVRRETREVVNEDGEEETQIVTYGGDVLLACNDPQSLYAELGANGSKGYRIHVFYRRKIYK